MIFEERAYQVNAINDCLAYLRSASKDRVVCVDPVGSGKSYIISAVAKAFGEPCIVLQPSAELLEQNLDKLHSLGGDAAIFCAKLNRKEIDHFTYATLGSIKAVVEKMKELGVKTVLIDECHAGYDPKPTSEFRKFMELLKPTKVIGFNATPWRLYSNMEGATLKVITRTSPKYFNKFVHITQVQEMLEGNYWAPLEYTAHSFDSSKLTYNSNGSEFTDASVKKAVEDQKINNKIYVGIRDLLAEGCKGGFIAFMDSRETGKKMASLFPNDVAYVDGETPGKERKKIVVDFKVGKIRGLINYDVFSIGFDHPPLEAIFIGRPTNSLSKYYQWVGRGVRKDPGNKNKKCRVFDYCGNVSRFGTLENLAIVNDPVHGMVVINLKDGVILTGVLMSAPRVSIYKKAGESEYPVEKIWFGKKHLGKQVNEVPIKDIKWYLEKFEFRGPRMQGLRKAFLRVLAEHESKILG